jgi:hypothetical protein
LVNDRWYLILADVVGVVNLHHSTADVYLRRLLGWQALGAFCRVCSTDN